MPQLYLIDPFSAERIGLSQSHLVPETLGSKVGVTFHQNVISVFKHFVLIFSLIFDQVDSFFVGLRSFDPYFYKTLDPIGSIFCVCWKFGEVPLLCSLHGFSKHFIINHIIWNISYSKSFMITISPTYLLVWKKNELVWVPVCTSGVFCREKVLSDRHSHLGRENVQNYSYPIFEENRRTF